MTTEIAVLNRLGVALAADSAVTISGGGTTKIFQSADKLFELSCTFPVALMLNGNMDCFGIPWELLIKDFRDAHGSGSNKSIRAWAETFVSFVESRSDINETSANNYIRNVAENELSLLKSEISNRFWALRSSGNGAAEDIYSIMTAVIADRMADLSNKPVAKSLNEISTESVVREYGSYFSDIIASQLKPLSVSEGLRNEIVMLIVASLRAIVPNEFSTGLIVAGYGDGDNYPSVVSVDIDGYVKGKLKYSDVIDGAKIERPEFGYAVSFAQTDVIERLLSGADPRFVGKTSEFLSEAAHKLAPLIVDAYAPKAARKRKNAEVKKIKQLLDIIEETYVSDTAVLFRSEFREEFERMIALMPKLELIELAEALISITAIERKATADEGTVGGPIDVAFVTKHEGFVWIKRKHYFDARLNPRYFWRKYQRVDTGGAS